MAKKCVFLCDENVCAENLLYREGEDFYVFNEHKVIEMCLVTYSL